MLSNPSSIKWSNAVAAARTARSASPYAGTFRRRTASYIRVGGPALKTSYANEYVRMKEWTSESESNEVKTRKRSSDGSLSIGGDMGRREIGQRKLFWT